MREISDISTNGINKILEDIDKEKYRFLLKKVKSALKLQELVKERMKEGGRYQPEIIRRKEGLLDMRDVVDKMRDDEYHIYKSLLEQSQTTLKEGVKE